MTTPNKRERENKKAKKKREKDERRWERRSDGPSSIPVVRAEDLSGDGSPTVEEIMASLSSGGGGGGGARPAARGIPAKLFIGGLSQDTDDASLMSAFAEHAEILEAVVVTDRDTGRSRGFGFVTLASHKDASRVVRTLDGADLDGRRIAVNVATDRR
ncbi:MAG: hypothetical protein KF729_38705 [Sandaracinaceae bacterium]|nr:hypothetical protein [Sandaracinaceae bacterium]